MALLAALTLGGCGDDAISSASGSATAGSSTGEGTTEASTSIGTGAGTTAGTTTGTASATGTTTSTSGETFGTTTGDPTTTTGTSTTGTTGTTGEPTTGDTTTGTTTTGTTTTTTTTGDTPSMSFFVSSTGSKTGNLGGLAGADERCQELAEAVGAGGKTWHAYLSVEKGDDDQPVHARDRIGEGPWYNANLVMLAADLDELHTLDGDKDLFLDENGTPINGQWADSPSPNEHDILTGSNKDGTVLPEKTCADWTSEDGSLFAQVGHSDGLGPNMSDDEFFRPWNSVHESGGCNDTAPKGGSGKVYCFAID